DGVMSIFKIGYNVAAQNTPILIVLLLKPNIKEEKAKSYFSYLAISFVIFEIILFLIVTVLGEYGGTKPFPVYSLVAVTQGTILKRYDSVYMFIWIFTALIRFSIFLFLSNKCAREFFPPKFKKHRTNITAIIILICTTITIFNITIFERIIRFAFSGVILISTGVVLPIILILMKKVKDKKKASAGDNYEK
ncbi:MAG: GerAB/ArcD/ProY family transporter, partial [Oscillospiraceae bacterium]